MSHIAFLGAGLIGAGMVEALCARGEQVTVFNRSQDKAQALSKFGATVAKTPAEAVRGARRVHIALSDDAAVDQTLELAREALTAGLLIVDHSTTSPAGVRNRIAAYPDQILLHAPVFMSPAMCRNPAGIMLISGAPSQIDPVREELGKMTGKLLDLGEDPARAAAFKLFGNGMILTLVGGLADVFAMAESEGISRTDALSLFEHFQLGNVLAFRGKNMARGDYAPSFHLSMARKDLGLMLDLLEASGEASAVLSSLAARFDARIAEGHGQQDVGVIAAKPGN